MKVVNYHGILRLRQGKIREFSFFKMLGTLVTDNYPKQT